MKAIKYGVAALVIFEGMTSAKAASENKLTPPPPAYYQRSQPVTAQLLFPDCIEPVDAALKEQCSLITSRIDFLEAKLKNLCSNAGEFILRTTDNVQGVYVHTPKNIRYGYFHENEEAWELFVIPMLEPHYNFWEVDKSWQGNKIAHCSYKPKLHNTTCNGLSEPESIYGITWRSLTSDTDQLQESIFGDELTVSNIRTNETLATRRFYFYVIKDNQISSGSGQQIRTPGIRNTFRTFIRACPNYSPKEDNGFVDKRPRHSIEFVSRVLRPAPLAR